MSTENVSQNSVDFTDDPHYQEWLDECGFLFDDLLEEGKTIAEAARTVDRQMIPYKKWRARGPAPTSRPSPAQIQARANWIDKTSHRDPSVRRQRALAYLNRMIAAGLFPMPVRRRYPSGQAESHSALLSPKIK